MKHGVEDGGLGCRFRPFTPVTRASPPKKDDLGSRTRIDESRIPKDQTLGMLTIDREFYNPGNWHTKVARTRAINFKIVGIGTNVEIVTILNKHNLNLFEGRERECRRGKCPQDVALEPYFLDRILLRDLRKNGRCRREIDWDGQNDQKCFPYWFKKGGDHQISRPSGIGIEEVGEVERELGTNEPFCNGAGALQSPGFFENADGGCVREAMEVGELHVLNGFANKRLHERHNTFIDATIRSSAHADNPQTR
ncbi:hypothetical protein FB451DRAFT_1181853 [Mycena latifolia]|nr:hypothetical protein FB451DRAFT_1181853 [Mycena latifolia]